MTTTHTRPNGQTVTVHPVCGSTTHLTAAEYSYNFGNKSPGLKDKWTTGVLRHVIAVVGDRPCLVTCQNSLMHLGRLSHIGRESGPMGGPMLVLIMDAGDGKTYRYGVSLHDLGAIVPLPAPGDTKAYALNFDVTKSIRAEQDEYRDAIRAALANADGLAPYGKRRVTPTERGIRVEFTPQADAEKVARTNASNLAGSIGSREQYYARPECIIEFTKDADGVINHRITFEASTVRVA